MVAEIALRTALTERTLLRHLADQRAVLIEEALTKARALARR